jgi:fructose-1,6-bisphosphatase I/sedoheptulose-1,7-bisphosphatase
MNPDMRITLTQFLIEERRRFPEAGGDFNSLLLNVALCCKRIARKVAAGALARSGIALAAESGPGMKPDLASREVFIEGNNWGGYLAGMASEDMAQPYQIPDCYPRGHYLLLFNPLDGVSNIDIDVPVGSIFSVLRAPGADAPAAPADFLQPGVRQLAAGYAIYGPATMLVLTVGNGVHGFTLCPQLGEFMLTHARLCVPPDTGEFAINASNSRFWEPPVTRYVNECMAGRTGPRGRDFTMRWVASTVADAHRILLRGGVFLCPRDSRDGAMPDRLRLLYEANPIGYLMEQAGGRASTGRQPVTSVIPGALQQRVGLIFGSKNEVELIERYHNAPPPQELPEPLFCERSLFRAPA